MRHFLDTVPLGNNAERAPLKTSPYFINQKAFILTEGDDGVP